MFSHNAFIVATGNFDTEGINVVKKRGSTVPKLGFVFTGKLVPYHRPFLCAWVEFKPDFQAKAHSGPRWALHCSGNSLAMLTRFGGLTFTWMN